MAKGISDSIDKILVGITLLGLIGVGAWVFMGLGKPLPDIEAETRVVKKQAEPLDMAPYMDMLDRIGTEYHSNQGITNSVMVSEPRVTSVNTKNLYYLIPKAAKVCPFTGEKQPDLEERDTDGDGMRDVYELEYGLNPQFDDLYADLDEDGFTNGEEFEAGTSPNDKEDHPPIITKVRMAKAVNRPYPFEFQGASSMGENDFVFSVKLLSSQTHFMRLNQEKEGWKVLKYEQRKKPEPGSPDKSILELENLKSGERVTLQINKRGGSGERWIAALVLLTEKEWRSKVEKGSEFELHGTTYQVIRLGRAGVQVKAIDGGEEFTLEKITNDELQVLRGEVVPRMPDERMMFPDGFMDPALMPPGFLPR